MIGKEMRMKIEKEILLPPPEELFRKSQIENELAKTGAPIPFIRFARLMGQEIPESLNPDN